jgi:hypothetical protein
MKSRIAWIGFFLCLAIFLLLGLIEVFNRSRLQSFLVADKGEFSATFFRLNEVSSLNLKHDGDSIYAKWTYIWSDSAEFKFKKPIDANESFILRESVLHYMSNPPVPNMHRPISDEVKPQP